MIQTACRRWVAVAAWLLLAGMAQAAGDTPPEFPSSPGNWINSVPMSVSTLKGKVALVLFYEGDCPQCRKAWPKLKTLSEMFKDQPVAFIGVTSGKPRGFVAEYAKTVGVTWPIVVDTTRSYENAALSERITTRNVIQLRLITASGHFQYVDLGDDLKTILNQAIEEGAAWKIKPSEVPASLKAAWLNVEFGNYPAAAATVQSMLTSNEPDVKATAEKLNAVIRSGFDSQLARAKECLANDKKWDAYQLYIGLIESYKGYEIPEEVSETKTRLANDPAIKKELSAAKSFERIKANVANAGPTARKQVVNSLEKFIKEHGDTIAGADAKDLLARVNSTPAGGKK